MKNLWFIAAFVVATTVGGTAFGQGSDDCATAEVITLAVDSTTSTLVDNTLALDSAPALPSACTGVAAGFGDLASDVWFQFVAPADGVVDVTTCPGALDTDVVVYQGDSANCGTLVEIDCNGDDPGAATFCSTVAGVPVISGVSYVVRVGGWDATQVGTTTLDITHFGSNPADTLVCTGNGNGLNPLADLTFNLPNPANGATNFDDVNIYLGGALILSLGPLPAGPQTVTSIAITTGGAQICVETVLGLSVSPQVCCTVFIADPCPASAGSLTPLPVLAPFVGNVNCNNGVNTVENHYFRAFDIINSYGVNDDITPTCFSMLVNAVNSPTNGTVPVKIRLHYDLNGGAPDNLANLTAFYEEEFQLPVMADEIFNFVFGTGVINPALNPTPNVGCLANVTAGATLVVEVYNDDYNVLGLGNFFTGSSDAAAGTPISPTYIMAPGCGLTQPALMSAIQPTALLPMELSYDVQVAGSCSGVGGVANLNCVQAAGTTTVDLTWTDAGGTGSFVIEADGNLVGTVGPATLAFTTPALPAYQVIDVTVTAFAGAGGTGAVISSRSCNVNVAPENSWLAGALTIGPGAVPYDITTAVTTQGPALDIADCDMDQGGLLGGGEQLFNDLYYTFIPAITGEVLVSTCSGTTGDSRLAIYTGSSNASTDVIACNDDRLIGGQTPAGIADNVYNPACTNFASELVFDATIGVAVTVRLGTFNPAGLIAGGELTLNDCVPVGNLAYTMDCTNGDVVLTWDDNPAATSINVLRDGVVVGASLTLGTTSFSDLAVADGDHTYEVVIDCGSGPNSASIPVSVLTYAGYTDLVFSMEGLQSSPLGDRGDIDSGAEMVTALVNNGRNAAMVRASFLDYTCGTGTIENVYVHLGTNQGSVIIGAGILTPLVLTVGPSYLLSSLEGDALANMASGADEVNVYIEGGDHWAYDHQPSLFDARDGIDDTTLAPPGFIAPFDGDDSLTGIDGLDGGFGMDLSALQSFGYLQDSLVNNDFTDQLTVATADGFGPNAAVVATIDDALVIAPAVPYNVMIHYDTDTGGNTVSSSFEFGGITLPTDRDAVAAQILAGFGGGPPVGQTFKRGNCNADATTNIADAIFLLGVLFPGPGGANIPPCQQACDNNDDNNLNIADAIYLLSVLFPGPSGPPVILPPLLTCGVDPTPSVPPPPATPLTCLDFLTTCP